MKKWNYSEKLKFSRGQSGQGTCWIIWLLITLITLGGRSSGEKEDEEDDFGDRGSAAEPKESREKFKLCDIEFGFGNGLVNGNRCPMTSFPRASTEHNKQPHSTKALPPAAWKKWFAIRCWIVNLRKMSNSAEKRHKTGRRLRMPSTSFNWFE